MKAYKADFFLLRQIPGEVWNVPRHQADFQVSVGKNGRGFIPAVQGKKLSGLFQRGQRLSQLQRLLFRFKGDAQLCKKGLAAVKPISFYGDVSSGKAMGKVVLFENKQPFA